MNRFARRAQSAMDRKGTGGGEHQALSFQQSVSSANRDALKPFVVECVTELEEILRQEFSRLMLDALAPLQTRLMVLEKLAVEKLGETLDTIAVRILDVEDEATGHTKVDGPAEAGDFLRVTAQMKVEGQEKWSRPAGIEIQRLAKHQVHPETGAKVYQTYEALERDLVGAAPGDTRETPVEITNGDVKVNYTFKVKVDRVSRNARERAFEAAQAKAKAEAEAAALAQAAEQSPSEQALGLAPEALNG